MKHQIDLYIAGLGIVFYSPFAVRNIPEGSDYLEEHFMAAHAVAQSVMDCTITAFGTGSSGNYLLNIFDGDYPERQITSSDKVIRLGIKVEDNEIRFRDLYDFMEWEVECESRQVIQIENGFYKITVFTSLTESGILGDDQVINLHFEKVLEKPVLKWSGVPDLSIDQVCDRYVM